MNKEVELQEDIEVPDGMTAKRRNLNLIWWHGSHKGRHRVTSHESEDKEVSNDEKEVPRRVTYPEVVRALSSAAI